MHARGVYANEAGEQRHVLIFRDDKNDPENPVFELMWADPGLETHPSSGGWYDTLARAVDAAEELHSGIRWKFINENRP